MKRALWMLAMTPAIAGLSSAALAQGQPQAAPLQGAVLDNQGAVIANAEVVIFREGATVAHRRTDQNGRFSFEGAPREYQVLINAAGFEQLRSGPVPFAAGSLSRFTLESGPIRGNTEVPPATPSTSAAGTLAKTPVERIRSASPWEYGVLAQGGVGTEDRSNYRFLSLGVHGGKVLTPNLGTGLLQGNFEYAVEVFPFWQAYTPQFQKVSCSPLNGTAEIYRCSQPYSVGGTFTGVSITPIQLRWNLTHGERWMPWLQGAGGVVWTNHKFPAIGNTNPADIASNGPSGDTSVWNFTPQFGIGTHYFLRPRRSLDFSANAVHISSASLGDKNPGVNASVQFTLGYSWWK